jgi:hypothetical protein
VSGVDDSRDDEFEKANNKLSEGLKSCRTVLSNYRALLEKESAETASKDDQTDDNSKGAPPAEG